MKREDEAGLRRRLDAILFIAERVDLLADHDPDWLAKAITDIVAITSHDMGLAEVQRVADLWHDVWEIFTAEID